MFNDLFKSGTLELSSEPLPQMMEGLAWSDMISNKVLVFITAALILINIRLLSDIMSALTYSFTRARGAIELEHNINKARLRNISALLFTLPFCLVADRFSLINPGFLSRISPEWHSLATIGIFFAYILLRNASFAAFKPKKADSEIVDAIHHTPYSFFIPTSALVILTAFVLDAAKVDTSTIITVLVIEILALYFNSLARSVQLLRSFCNAFSTFLYLCALEFLPTAILVVCLVKL